MGLDIFFLSGKDPSYEIGYFRKVNFLVKYFSDLGFDVANQQPFKLNKEQIEKLLSRCNTVLKDNEKAAELLPTMSGFFFGSTEYDEYYFQDVEEVRDYINEILIPYINEHDDDVYFNTWY